MSVSGLCEICGTPGVEHTCDRCGQLVCDRHFDASLGVCVECASEVGQPGDPARSPDTDHDDVDTYRY
jgi:hypothetical protein